MLEIIAIIAIGILLGCLNVFSYKSKMRLHRMSTGSLFLMLVCLGAKIGCDDKLLAQIEILGWQSFVLGVFTIIGSLIALYIVIRFFGKKAEPDVKAGDGEK